jgi:hypothetical protein
MNDELHAAVARMAYRIWDEEGQPEGLADAHWQRAEFKLMGLEGAEKPLLAGLEIGNL